MNDTVKQLARNLLTPHPEVDARIEHGIELHRKGTASFTVADAKGAKVPGAEVTFTLKRHDFDFGCNAFVYRPLLDFHFIANIHLTASLVSCVYQFDVIGCHVQLKFCIMQLLSQVYDCILIFRLLYFQLFLVFLLNDRLSDAVNIHQHRNQ